MKKVEHPFEPVFDQSSKILILGSFPSVVSCKQQFYYGHRANRFWKIMGALFNEEIPVSIEAKTQFLHSHHIALWDVIKECEIEGSSDASIKKVVVNDFESLFEKTSISRVLGNGKTAVKLYRQYCKEEKDYPICECPSTSPANASYSLEQLIKVWRLHFFK